MFNTLTIIIYYLYRDKFSNATMDVPKLEELLKGNTNYLGRLYIQKHYPEFYQYLIERYCHIPWKKFSELLYLYYHNMNDRPKCKCCNNSVDFLNFTEGYRIYCSVKCQTNDPDIINKGQKHKKERYGDHYEKIIEKAKKTKLEKYGDENYNNIDKNRQTKLERYNDEYYSNTEKAKKTSLEKYGCEFPMQNKEIKEKSLRQKIEIYGEDNVSNQIKIKQTCQERYGVSNVFKLDSVKEKIKQTNLKKYGFENSLQNKEIKNKAIETSLERYGCMYPAQNEEVKEKIKQINLEKYGVENIMKLEEYKEKIKQTNFERYGVEYYTQTKEYKEKTYNTKKQNGTFNTSKIEEDFAMWLDKHNINYIRQYHDDRYPFNCDFYFLDKDLFLEIQGSWVHGDHPYNPDDKNDQEELQFMESKNSKYYENAIETWTTKDVKKRQVAKENNLNWIEVFTTDLNELTDTIKDLL